jgi:hypothetical protein
MSGSQKCVSYPGVRPPYKLKYACKTASRFRPLVFSIGGAQEAEMLKVFEEWQKVMGEGTYSFLCRRISLMLLRARVKWFVC